MSTMKTLTSRLLLGLLVFGLAGALSLAGTKSTMVITPDGDLFQVEEVAAEAGGIPTKLRATIYDASGGVNTRVIRHTAGTEFDTSPSLAIDPDTGQPALVWSRYNGSDFDVVLSVFNGATWSRPVTLASTGSNEVEPKAFTAPGDGLHVLWGWPGEPNAFGYGLFRTATGIAVRGPDKVTPLVESRARGARRGTQRRNPFAEGGIDDPGTGFTIPPSHGDGTCTANAVCPFRGSGDGRESGAVLCGNKFSVTVEVARRVCVLTNDAGAWSQVCYPKRVRLDNIRKALEKFANAACEP